MLVITFPDLGLQLGNSDITEESFFLRESILESDSIEFVGCISSRLELELISTHEDLKGQRVNVSICTPDTQEEPISLFHGIVDTCPRKANSYKKSLTAYDQLYTKGCVDVSAWYNGLTYPISLLELRNSLFEYLGISQVATSLPNDAVSIIKQYEPTSLQAVEVIKAICQINGAFGIINRDDCFEYRILQDAFLQDDAYPPLYPPFYPGSGQVGSDVNNENRVDLGYYKEVQYEDYTVKPVDKLTIRQSDSDTGVSYGEGENNYIIQGNMFTYGKDAAELLQMAQNIYPNIAGIEYRPFTAENNGLPWVELGKNTAKYVVKDYSAENQTHQTYQVRAVQSATDTDPEPQYTEKTFYMFSREMKGVQALQDTYTADGEEYQTEFITDLQTQLETRQTAENAVKDYTYSRAELDEKLRSWYRIVDALPAIYETGVIYFVRK